MCILQALKACGVCGSEDSATKNPIAGTTDLVSNEELVSNEQPEPVPQPKQTTATRKKKPVLVDGFQESILRDVFDTFDINGDGVLDASELSALIQKYLKLDKPPTQAQIERIMAKVDDNSNGLIEFEEFKAMMGLVKNNKEAYLMKAEASNLLDDEGYLTKENLEKMIREIQSDWTSEEIELILQSLEPDAEGKVSLAEFLHYFVG